MEVTFPNTFSDFLNKCGCFGLGSQEIYGLYKNVIIDITINERNINKDPKFPHAFILIHALGNGELSCLDTSQINEEGECPVVAWYFVAKLSNGKYEVLAEDFGAFLLEKVKWGLESLEKNKKDGSK